VTRQLLMFPILLLVLACAHLPPITPITAAPPSGFGQESCNIFPEGKWQFFHSIRAQMPGGRNFVMMGVTVMSSRLRTSRSVIMTLEGFVVFDGEYDQHLIVHRALPPFDSPHFAEGLMDDIRLIFLEPGGPLIGFGELENGSVVCRHATPDGSTVDIIPQRDGAWELRRFSPDQRLIRTVRALPGARSRAGFPEALELAAYGDQTYKLTLTLVEALQVEP
jgi:hypothetical protein